MIYRGFFGHLLESFVLLQWSLQASWLSEKTRMRHYRDKDKVEVDCVLTRGDQTWGVEIKAAGSIKSSDSKGLRRLAEQAGNDYRGGIDFYDGTTVLPIDRKLNLYAVPISKLWQL